MQHATAVGTNVELGKKETCPEGFRTRVKLFGQTWTIKYVAKIQDGDDELYGYSDPGPREIAISTELCFEAMRDTLLHEILHSYYRMSPCMSDGTGGLPEDTDKAEEALVVLHTTAMIDLLQNNRWVRDLLCKE